jgi:signal transduction histidine kinase
MLKLDFLKDIVGILQEGMASGETYAAVFKLIERTVDYQSATLFIYDEHHHSLQNIHQVGPEVVDLISDVNFEAGMGLSSWILKQESPVILSDLTRSRPGKDQRFSSFVSMPLRAAGKLIGVLNLGHAEAGFYDLEDQDDFQMMASEISLVVETFLLRQRLQDRNQALSKALADLQDTQGQLVESERLAAIGELVVTVNHEINNPLTSIIGLAEILEISVATAEPEKVQEGMKAIKKEARRIQRITEKLSRLQDSSTDTYVGETRMTRLPA